MNKMKRTAECLNTYGRAQHAAIPSNPWYARFYRQNYLTDMRLCLTRLSCIFQHLNQHGVGTTVRQTLGVSRNFPGRLLAEGPEAGAKLSGKEFGLFPRGE